MNASIPDHLLFWEKELNLEAQRPVRRKLRPFDVAQCLQLSIKGNLPTLNNLSILPPRGTVHRLLLSAFQLAVITGELVKYQPPGRL